MKKFFVILFVIVLVGLGCLPWWTSRMAEQAFEDFTNPDSPKKVAKAIDFKMRLIMYTQARTVAEEFALYFPEDEGFPRILNKAALCGEKERKPLIALHWYRRLVELFPKHELAQDAKAKIERLKGIYEQ